MKNVLVLALVSLLSLSALAQDGVGDQKMDARTGVLRSGLNEISINTNNARAWSINSTGDTTQSGTCSSTGLRFPVANYAAIAGAGTTSANAAVLTAGSNIFRLTGANGTVGWRLPASVAGEFKILLNTTAGVANIYANTGGTVNGGSVDAAFVALTGIKPILCFSTAVDTWICS